MNDEKFVINNPWRKLKNFTDARIGLGRSGISIPTKESLEFQLAHARARDAVNTPLNFSNLSEQLTQLQTEQSSLNSHEPIKLHSQAVNRQTYLQRPDLGRRLQDSSAQQLKNYQDKVLTAFDLAIIIADGLSARAIEVNAIAFLSELITQLESSKKQWSLAPITLVEQGRVAIADDVGELLNAKATLILIGERPGLSSPDSLGLYLTWNPAKGLKDDRRNCISNVRKAGLSYSQAARKTRYLLSESERIGSSGVVIKDRTDNNLLDQQDSRQNFLVKT